MKLQTLTIARKALSLALSPIVVLVGAIAPAGPNDGKTGINARYVSFDSILIDGQLYANDVLSVNAATEFELGGYYRPVKRLETAHVTKIENPVGDSVMGTITVEVEIGKSPTTTSELDTSKLVPNSVYNVKVLTAGRETVPMTNGETYFTYYGVQKNLTPPIKYGMYMVRSDEKIKTSAEQLEQMMIAYRKLCAKLPDDCKSGSGFTLWLTSEGIKHEHNRMHTEVAYEQYISFRLEQEQTALQREGKELSIIKKKELIGLYQGILKRYKTYDPLTAPIDIAYLSKIKREARLLQLDVADLEK